MTSILRHSNWRYLLRHPWQLSLAILGVALGVAVAVAVDLANSSAEHSFLLSMQELTGEATHQIIGGPAGLSEAVYTGLRRELGIRNSVPLVEAYGKSAQHSLHLIGLDILAYSDTGPHKYLEEVDQATLTRLLIEPNTVLIGRKLARRMALKPGDRFTAEFGGKTQQVRVLDIITTAQGSDDLIFGDIATAQELSNKLGYLSWIDLVLDDNLEGRQLQQKIRAWLPPQASLLPAAHRTDAMEQMTRAFRTNLTAMSLLAMVVGTFLIYNTMTFTVLQRRRLLATLRLVGVTRTQIFRLIILEALFLALIGSGLGIILGIILANSLVDLVTRTIDDLYFALSVKQLTLSALPLIKGLLLGLGATLIAVLIPAHEASSVSAHQALQRSVVESRVHNMTPRLALLGSGLCFASLLLLNTHGDNLILGFSALFMVILGMTLISPWLISWLTRFLSWVAGRHPGLQTRLALRGINASLSRTGVAIAALMLALSVTVGVGIMVTSFRHTVALWLDTTLRADIFVSAPSFRSTRSRAQLDERILAQVKHMPEVIQITTGRYVTVESDESITDIFALGIEQGHWPQFKLKQGSPETVWPAFLADQAVVISEPYAFRHQLQTGDKLVLRTDKGNQNFHIAGIFYDYDSGPGTVLMHRNLYNRFFEDSAIGSLGLYLAPGSDTEHIISQLQKKLSPIQLVNIISNKDLRLRSLEIFDRTFTITNVLRLLAIIVAFIGILSALMALQLERMKELAILRATGFTPRQIAGMILLQTSFMGIIAGILSLPTGYVLAQLLTQVINLRSFGWSMNIFIPADALGSALLLALAAALIAGIYPAWKMAHINPAHALREE